MSLPKIYVPMGVDLSGIDRGLSEASRHIDRWVGDASRSMVRAAPPELPDLPAPTRAALPSPAGAGSAGAGADAAADIAPALVGGLASVGAAIQSQMTRALAPLTAIGGRITAQIDAVGGTITTLARRIDAEIKRVNGFKTLGDRINQARELAAKGFTRIGAESTKMARVVDQSFQLASTLNRVKSWWDKVGDVARKGLDRIGSFKVPKINFDQSITTKSITNITNATNAAASSMKGFGVQVAVALGAFGLTYKAVDFLKSGVASAMNFGETLSKVDTVFGPASENVKGQAAEMAKAFGLPKQAILDASASIGLVAKASGQGQAGAAAMANDLSKLAADAASFYNVPLDDALAKIKSGLVGEAEPIRAFGVLLSEEAVQAEAFAKGLVKGNEELTEGAKVQARASLIMKGLKDANGDLARTIDSPANQARKFQGTLENLGTSIGAMLLPALGKGLSMLNDFASYVGRAFEENKATLQSWGDYFGEVIATVGNYLTHWRDTWELVRLSISEGITNIGARFEVLGPNIATVASYIAENWTSLMADAFNATIAGLKNLWKNWSALSTAVVEWLANPTQGFKVDWTPMLDGFEATTKKMPALLKPQLVSMQDEMAKVANKIQGNTDKAAAAAKPKDGPAAPRGTLAEGGSAESGETPTKKLRTFLDKVKEDIKTPEEKYKEGMEKLEKGLKAGQLTAEQFQRGRREVAKDAGLNSEVKRSGATSIDSAEGYSQLVAALQGRTDGWARVERVQLATLAETRKGNDLHTQAIKATDRLSRTTSQAEDL